MPSRDLTDVTLVSEAMMDLAIIILNVMTLMIMMKMMIKMKMKIKKMMKMMKMVKMMKMMKMKVGGRQLEMETMGE